MNAFFSVTLCFLSIMGEFGIIAKLLPVLWMINAFMKHKLKGTQENNMLQQVLCVTQHEQRVICHWLYLLIHCLCKITIICHVHLHLELYCYRFYFSFKPNVSKMKQLSAPRGGGRMRQNYVN